MKNFKIILLIVLIFFAGFVAGIVATRVVVRYVIERAIAHPELVRERIELTLDRRLRLDPGQQRQVHEILLDAHGRIKTLRGQFQPQFVTIFTNAEGNISAVLTPEQQQLFEHFQAEHPFFFPKP